MWAVNVSDALETSTLAEAELKLLLWSFTSKKVRDRPNFLSGGRFKREKENMLHSKLDDR